MIRESLPLSSKFELETHEYHGKLTYHFCRQKISIQYKIQYCRGALRGAVRCAERTACSRATQDHEHIVSLHIGPTATCHRECYERLNIAVDSSTRTKSTNQPNRSPRAPLGGLASGFLLHQHPPRTQTIRPWRRRQTTTRVAQRAVSKVQNAYDTYRRMISEAEQQRDFGTERAALPRLLRELGRILRPAEQQPTHDTTETHERSGVKVYCSSSNSSDLSDLVQRRGDGRMGKQQARQQCSGRCCMMRMCCTCATDDRTARRRNDTAQTWRSSLQRCGTRATAHAHTPAPICINSYIKNNSTSPSRHTTTKYRRVNLL